MIPSTGLPRIASGTNSSGGAQRMAAPPQISSGAPSMKPRYAFNRSTAASIGKSSMPPKTSGPTSCSLNSKPVTTPKLPPPPFSAQNRSGLRSALATRWRPSAVITSAEMRLSTVSPYLRSIQPLPPPSVSPPTPVSARRPPVTARPKAWVSRSSSPHFVPPPHHAVRRSGSTRTRFIGRRSIVRPSSTMAWPATACPPPLTDTSNPCSLARASASITSATPVQRAITAGRRSTAALKTLRASSYPGSPSRSSSPPKPSTTAGSRIASAMWSSCDRAVRVRDQPSEKTDLRHGQIQLPRDRLGEFREARRAEVDDPVHEEPRRARNAAPRAAPKVLLDALGVRAVTQLGGEALDVGDADRVGVAPQLLVGESQLILEQPIVHLPEAAPGSGGLGRLRRRLRTRVQVVERHVAEHEPEPVAEALEQRVDHRVGVAAVGALEVGIFHERHRGVGGAKYVVTIGIDRGVQRCNQRLHPAQLTNR